MRKLFIIGLVVLAALVGVAGWADPRDLNGQSLYTKWQEINKPAPADETGLLNHAQALEYYSGYVDALACFGSDQGWYQIPTNATYGQLYTVVGKWLEEPSCRLEQACIVSCVLGFERSFSGEQVSPISSLVDTLALLKEGPGSPLPDSPMRSVKRFSPWRGSATPFVRSRGR